MSRGFKSTIQITEGEIGALQSELTRQKKSFIQLKNEQMKNNNRLDSKYEEAILIINRNLQNFRYELSIRFQIQAAMNRKLQEQLDLIKKDETVLHRKIQVIEGKIKHLEQQISE